MGPVSPSRLRPSARWLGQVREMSGLQQDRQCLRSPDGSQQGAFRRSRLSDHLHAGNAGDIHERWLSR